LRWDLTNFLCPRWPGAMILWISSLKVTWDSRHKPPYPAIGWDGMLWTSTNDQQMRLASNHDLKPWDLISVFQVARITALSHQHLAIGVLKDEVMLGASGSCM
jgi:hypothetical protein